MLEVISRKKELDFMSAGYAREFMVKIRYWFRNVNFYSTSRCNFSLVKTETEFAFLQDALASSANDF